MMTKIKCHLQKREKIVVCVAHNGLTQSTTNSRPGCTKSPVMVILAVNVIVCFGFGIDLVVFFGCGIGTDKYI